MGLFDWFRPKPKPLTAHEDFVLAHVQAAGNFIKAWDARTSDRDLVAYQGAFSAIASLAVALRRAYPDLLIEDDSPALELLAAAKGAEQRRASHEVIAYMYDQLKRSEGNDDRTFVVMRAMFAPRYVAGKMNAEEGQS